MFSEFATYVTIIVISIIGLLYSFFVSFQNKLNNNVQPKYQDNNDQQPLADGYESVDVQHQQSQYYQGVTNHISKATTELFYNQSIIMIFFALIFAAMILSWLPAIDYSPLLIVSFIIGCICVALNTFVTLKISVSTISKMVILNSDENIFAFGYMSASSISVFVVSIILLVFSIIIPCFQNYVIKEKTQLEFTGLFMSILGFGIGNAYASLFYREVGSISSKGILIGTDLIVRSNYSNDEQNRIKMNLDMAHIISNIYTNNIVAILDYQTVFTAFICCYLVIVSSCQEINEKYKATYYMPLFLLALNLIVAICVSFLSKSPENSSAGLASQTAKSIKIQLLVCNAVSLVFLVLFPIFLMPSSFSIGTEEQHTFSHLDIGRADAIWSLLAGLIAQMMFLLYSEYMTSHYHNPVRSIAKKEQDATSQKQQYASTILQAHYQANISLLVMFVYLCFVCLIGYILAGFFGIACCTMGLLSGPFCLISVNNFAGFTSEAFQMSAVGCVFSEMRNKIYQLSWTSKNYSIFPQIITVVGILMSNLITVGATLILSEQQEIYLWDAYGLFGFLYGGSLVYLIKGTSTLGIKDVAEKLKLSYDNSPFLGEDSNLRQVQTLVYSSYHSAIYKTAFNISVSLGSLVMIGILLGAEAVIAFLLGINLVGIYLAFSSLIIGYSIKNAREYNKNIGEIQNGDEVSVQSDIAVSAIEGVPGTSLVIYLILLSLVVLQGAKYWNQYGIFRKWADIDQGLSQMADGSTKWVNGPLGNIEKSLNNVSESLSHMFDGENNNARRYNRKQ